MRFYPKFIIPQPPGESNHVTMPSNSIRGLRVGMSQHNHQPEFELMQEKIQPRKRYIFASDFDQTLSFNDSGYVLSELIGIPASEYERKIAGMTKLNLVQQGASSPICCCTIPSSAARFAPSICMRRASACV